MFEKELPKWYKSYISCSVRHKCFKNLVLKPYMQLTGNDFEILGEITLKTIQIKYILVYPIAIHRISKKN